MIEYRVQKGKLSANYKDVLVTQHKKWAWKTYFETTLECGEKKRIQEMYIDNDAKPKTLKQDSRYWTQGYGER